MTKRKTPEPVKRGHMMRALKVMMAERGFIDEAGNVDEAAIEAAEKKAKA